MPYVPHLPLALVVCVVGGGTRRASRDGLAVREKVGLNQAPGNPVTSCRLNSKFAFCVMRNPEEAAKALNLNGIPYLGNVLKLVSMFLLFLYYCS